MIGKPEWFQRRKYGGWGLYPKTVQGWMYVVALFAVLFGIQYLPVSGDVRLVLMVIFAVVFSADLVHIMVTMPRDERDRMHEAFAERNAMWAMLAVLVVGVAYRAAQSAATGQVYIDPVILIALGAAVVAKAITNFYLDRRN